MEAVLTDQVPLADRLAGQQVRVAARLNMLGALQCE